MSTLASYVEKYILNPAAAIDVDEGNEETRANVAERVEGDEGARGVSASRSKLRIQNSQLLSERDPRYKGKKITRKNGSEKVSFDPELAKYIIMGDDSDEELSDSKLDEDDNSDEVVDDSDSESEASHKINKCKTSKEPIMLNEDFWEMAEDIEEDDCDDSSSNSDKGETNNYGNDDDGDNEIYDDVDENEEDTLSNDNSEEENDITKELGDIKINEENMEEGSSSIKTFSNDYTNEDQKGIAIKNQCSLYDAMFEIRIGLQKVINVSNQLPQFDTYKSFLQEDYPHYKNNLQNARKALKNVVGDILNLQELLLLQNKETQHILTNKLPKAFSQTDDEITNSEDEAEESTHVDIPEESNKSKKRKVEEYGSMLSKRYKAMIPYRDDVLNKWHEKTKLLANQQGANKFGGFEVSAVQQLKNILANKEALIKRTQMHGISRGNTYRVLGKTDSKGKEEDSLLEEHDPEIFDDGDFYSRMLEEVLKSKMSLSQDLTEVSRRWIDIQKLRKKAKRKVDTKASKGRKIRYEVMSKLQQFLAPCKHATMDDFATNTLFGSLFGKSIEKKIKAK